ncbi:S1C family serine protease [Bryobacter aggregatus]|uniref:S1C family serine protease n=1 Tax=Bryobacter aggregatus TaxID=360054 RepID=UPI0004E150B1|nr:trypsin-like peptidase domain-containing protein [Bryobacter aggregatus]
MKLRIIGLVAVIVGGFVYATSVAKWNPRGLLSRATGGAVADTGAPLWSGPSVTRGAGLSSDEVNNVEIYKMAHPATVFITSTTLRQDFFLQVYPSKATGSGFVINDRGQILTNFHVVNGSQELTVTTTDKKNYKAVVLDKDPDNDLALIQVETKGAKLANLRLGDSDKVQIGQKVLAIGNPFGLEGTLTTGIVSSMGRAIGDENGRTLEGMIQTDASINPGNSGGPLLDSQGNVIGINTAIYGPNGSIGIGFAMPINRAREMLDAYSSGRKYAPPILGVEVLPIAGDLAQELGYPAEGGLLVTKVRAGSAAAKAGIKGGTRTVQIGRYYIEIGGDLLVQINGRQAEDGNSIPRALRGKRAGDSVEIALIRSGKKVTVQATLQAASDAQI